MSRSEAVSGNPAGRYLAATIAVGVAAGLGGAGLTLLLHAVQHLAFGYTENTFLVGVERASGPRRVLAMTIGGLVVGLAWWQHRRRWDADDVSVTRALRDRCAHLPVIATVIDAMIQIAAVGIGASLGREGAPRQVGAAFAGWLAARLGLETGARHRLLACGAGAGLAAVYNVPLGGAVFAVEVLLTSLAWRDLVTALVTSAIGALVAWPLLGEAPTYHVHGVHLADPVWVWAALFAPLAGGFGVLFVRTMTLARRHAPTGWPAVGSITVAFAIVGALAIAYPALLGNGKGPAQLAFGATMSLGLALALVVLKPLATALCLRGGAIGGLLTPALATGAVLGIATGRIWDSWWPGAPLADYAIIAAATVLAVTQRAPITAIALTVEFLHTGYPLAGPAVLAIVVATATAAALDRSQVPALLRRVAPKWSVGELWVNRPRKIRP